MFFNRQDSARTEAAPEKMIPLLPLRDVVVYPSMVIPLFVGRERSIKALEKATDGDKTLLVVAQRDARANDPSPDDMFDVGCLTHVMQLLRLPDGTVKVLVEGRARARVARIEDDGSMLSGSAEPLIETPADGVEVEALTRTILESFEQYSRLNKRVAPETLLNLQSLKPASKFADAVAAHLTSLKLEQRQKLLESTDVSARLELLLQLVAGEIDILQVEKRIKNRVKRQMEKTQREYYLNEQMQAIQRELGEKDEFRSELLELEEKASAKSMPEEARTKLDREIRKLKLMQPMSAEATVVRNYVDWILALPWDAHDEIKTDLAAASEILDEDHYGLQKIKDRILEHLAVQSLTGGSKGQILCFVGPPGVGKTSLATSIARATGRKFSRIALGGVRDEAEVRGHRRTYIGAMPGRILQALKRAAVSNPVMLLDEIDKMSSDLRGDPASALLEVLDPEQNRAFGDHYLDMDYDLSKILFIATANTLSGIPVPLQDRMEIIELSGYTEFEKRAIARRYLVPRQRKDAGLEPVTVEVDDGAIDTLIHNYTRESGVRRLERTVGAVMRKLAKEMLLQGAPEAGFAVDARRVVELLGPEKYRKERSELEPLVGLTTGLAYTAFGGVILDCEATVTSGKGKLQITGLLEKGMQESAQAALSYIRSRREVLELDAEFHQNVDIHLHFPEFVPKDGPSAGITMATSMASALTRTPVRREIAMTGEITLRGRILPIGGLKEKLLAAHRHGVTLVLVPEDNMKDLEEVPQEVLSALTVKPVSHMDEVLALALVWPEGSRANAGSFPESDADSGESGENGVDPNLIPARTPGSGRSIPSAH